MNHPPLPERRTDDVIRWRYRTAIQAARMLNATKGEGGETSERSGFPAGEHDVPGAEST